MYLQVYEIRKGWSRSASPCAFLQCFLKCPGSPASVHFNSATPTPHGTLVVTTLVAPLKDLALGCVAQECTAVPSDFAPQNNVLFAQCRMFCLTTLLSRFEIAAEGLPLVLLDTRSWSLQAQNWFTDLIVAGESNLLPRAGSVLQVGRGQRTSVRDLTSTSAQGLSLRCLTHQAPFISNRPANLYLCRVFLWPTKKFCSTQQCSSNRTVIS